MKEPQTIGALSPPPGRERSICESKSGGALYGKRFVVETPTPTLPLAQVRPARLAHYDAHPGAGPGCDGRDGERITAGTDRPVARENRAASPDRRRHRPRATCPSASGR